ncbi:acyl-CoA dehydrogenase family protein, partial [candidate division KSB1 bacterium]
MEKDQILKGGEFLVKEVKAKDVFIPEEFSEEQKMIIETCEDFLEKEIFPNLNRIDSMEPGLMRSLISKAGEYGLLGISIPEEFEGYDQSFLTSMRANEAIGCAYSYSVAFMAHTGIGTLPILYYGSEEQKKKYIPKLATGEWAAAYCLTEPNAGSDANSGKSKAVLSDDGQHYILNGQKMWITNGGFADVLTVFAKIDNDRVLSAFIVEKDYEGLSITPEERKMGIKGSSTVQVFFNDCKVPVENLLGKRGEGFRIALSILHIGRIKLGGTVLGAAKREITHSVEYANERKQFGNFISSYGAIKYKLAEQVIKTFTTESAVYRASKYVDDLLEVLIEEGMEKGKANIEGVSQYAVEAALLKVLGSEILDYVVDEAVQIYGGMGFSAEGPVDRAYRDSRINRIFEGTNEINRLLIVDTTIKNAQKGMYDLFEPAGKVLEELVNLKEDKVPASYYEEKIHYVKNFKKIALMLIASSSDYFKKQLVNEQEILFNISDIMMQIYAAESTTLRVEKLEKEFNIESISIYKDI